MMKMAAMTKGDAYEPKPAVKRVIRIMALASPLLVLSAGLLFAQTQNTPGTTASAASISATSAPTTQASSTTLAKPGITLAAGSGEND